MKVVVYEKYETPYILELKDIKLIGKYVSLLGSAKSNPNDLLILKELIESGK